jgi:cytochrome d ubiquinol oxidase subunit II
MDYTLAQNWLPLFFLVAMGISILLYVVLDGYDLGVGILMNSVEDPEKDVMISSIGPFWDANETWIVLGVGVLLIAFPMAHGIILHDLYLPAALMLMFLVLRGISFDFRAKVPVQQKHVWNRLFFIGSLGATFCQGVMIGRVILGLEPGIYPWLFACLVGVCLPFGYSLLGASWLILKTEGELQIKAIDWARKNLFMTGVCILVISAATPWVSGHALDKWFEFPNIIFLAPIPLLTIACFYFINRRLRKIEGGKIYREWGPLVLSMGIFILSFIGIAYTMFPYLVLNQMDIWQAAAATESLWVIFWGVAIVLPAILAYTFITYRIFWGKTEALSYY